MLKHALATALLLTIPGILAASNVEQRLQFESAAPEFEAATVEYQNIWANEGIRIIQVMESITGLRVESSTIHVIVHEGISASGYKSKPMMLRASYDPQTKRGTLVHELSHRLLSDYVDKDFDDHPVIFLFLYDVWTDLWGKQFADRQVAIESERTGHYDYAGAWQDALALTRQQRGEKWAGLFTGRD